MWSIFMWSDFGKYKTEDRKRPLRPNSIIFSDEKENKKEKLRPRYNLEELNSSEQSSVWGCPNSTLDFQGVESNASQSLGCT